jgi:hypothetical protein
MLMNKAVAGLSHYSTPDNVVVFNPATRLYYHLDEIAAFVWGLVGKPMSISEICTAVQAMFDMEPDTCQHDVATLLKELEDIGLIEAAG